MPFTATTRPRRRSADRAAHPDFAIRNAFRTGWQTVPTRNYTIVSIDEESVYALRTDGCPSSLDVLCGLELGHKPLRCF